MTEIGIGAIAYDTEPNAITAEIVIYDLINGEEELSKKHSSKQSIISSVRDTGGNTILGDATISNTITARWLNDGSNRVTMPSFKQGEQVKVYQYGDSDRYYFTPFHLEKDLRRKEIAVYAFSNRDDKREHGEHFDKDSSYTFTVDTVNKLVEFKTSKSDNELVLYTMSFDTKSGIFTLEDDKKNQIKLDSKTNTLTMTVPNIKLIGDTLDIQAKKSINIESPDIKIGKSKMEINSKVTFKKSCDHKASVAFNGLSQTKIASHKPHVHKLA